MPDECEIQTVMVNTDCDWKDSCQGPGMELWPHWMGDQEGFLHAVSLGNFLEGEK